MKEQQAHATEQEAAEPDKNLGDYIDRRIVGTISSTDGDKPECTIEQLIWDFTVKFDGLEKTRDGYNYKYANIDDVYNAAIPVMRDVGLGAVDWIDVVYPEGFQPLTCLCVRVFDVSNPQNCLDSSVPLANTADSQKFGSELTYKRRYLLVTMLNIREPGQDDDGQATVVTDNPSIIVLGFGKYHGENLGWVAQKDLGYLKYLAQSAKDSWIKEAASALVERHAEPLTDDEVSDRLQDADSIDELASLKRLLDDAQQIEFKAAFDERRKTLKAAQPKRDADNARA